MEAALLEVTHCRQCPHFYISGVSSTDDFDKGEDWACKKANKIIQGFVEWHEEKKVPVPEWCPLRK